MSKIIKFTLNNSAGELDSFVADDIIEDDDGAEIHAALLAKLESDWTLLHEGDSITIQEVE